jgi:WS/DGAT/MGAT family acyltransferase
MDRQRPLWDFTLVHGLDGGNTGLITRVHHCLADGLAGIGLMSALLGQKPPLVRMTRKTNSAPARHAAPDLLENFVTACFSAVQQVLTAQSELLAIGQRMVAARKHQAREAPDGEAQLGSLFEQWSRYLPELAAPAQRLPFNVVCRGPQRFHWTEIPVADIKAVRQAAGATFNDVALAAIALTVRRYAESHGVGTADRLLRIVVPVSVRDKVDAAELGNRITFLPVNVPLDMENPRDLLAAVGERMSNLKSARLAEFVGFAGTLLGTIPSLVQALLGPLASQLPLSVCNLIFTNVRGPEGPLHLLGHKMLSCYPYVPIGGEMGMNCAVLSYNGTAYFGFTGDAKAVPDLKRFEKLLAASFAELRRAAGSRGPRKKAARPQAKPAVEATAGAPAADVPQEPPALAKAAVA